MGPHFPRAVTQFTHAWPGHTGVYKAVLDLHVTLQASQQSAEVADGDVPGPEGRKLRWVGEWASVRSAPTSAPSDQVQSWLGMPTECV